MATSVGDFISGATSTGLCSGPSFTIELFTTTPPLIVGSDLFLNAGGNIYPPDPGYYSDGINTYLYKDRVIDEIIPCVDYFVGCGEVVECDNEFVDIGPSSDPDDIFNNWYRFAFFGTRTITFSPIPGQNSGLQPDGTIITDNPAFYFYTGVTNTYYLGEFNISMTEGENIGPFVLQNSDLNKFYYN
jgi:hypothetical protein